MSGEMDAQSGGDIGVSIDKNYGPITISYGASGGGSGGGDEPPSGFMYFSDMTLNQLNDCKQLALGSLNLARKEILFSVPVISMAIHALGLIAVPFNIAEFIGIVKLLQEYTILLPVSLLVTLHFLRKKVDTYTPLMSQYKGEIAGIEKELLHRRISSR